MEKNQEKVIFDILLSKIVLLILVPILAVSVFIVYDRKSADIRYLSESSVLVSSSNEIDLDYLDMYIKLTTSIREIGQSSMVTNEVYERMDEAIDLDVIQDSLEFKSSNNSQIITIISNYYNEEVSIKIAKTTAEVLKEQVDAIYNQELLTIIDTPSSIDVEESKESINKLGLIFVGGSAFILTLFTVLALGLKKENQ